MCFTEQLGWVTCQPLDTQQVKMDTILQIEILNQFLRIEIFQPKEMNQFFTVLAAGGMVEQKIQE